MKSNYFLIITLLLFLCQGNNYLLAEGIGAADTLKTERPKVGLVLSGGGAKGFAYIGLFRVLEEVGLPIDYVGGASIGSIMAGLYAVGYSADEIERIVRKQDWEMILRDEIPRKYIAYEEKELWEKSIVSLLFKKRKLGMGGSLYYGQQVNLLLNRFFSPAWDVVDFGKLQTPFLCVATDLFTGQPVELTTGYLPMAIRASMSIPGYFAPTFYQDKYLVDGGIVNNYPAVDVQKMGAQLLIGGDVQSPLKDNMDDLASVASVIDQIVSFSRIEANDEAKKLLDLDIHFTLEEGMMDFTKYNAIIATGERVARAHYDVLKKLADSLNAIEYKPMRKFDATPLDHVNIKSVEYRGNNKMSNIYLDNYFEDFEHSTVQYDDIEETVTMVYGTGFFKYVFYELEPAGDEWANLIIVVEEGAPGYVSAAVHYDVDYLGSILLGGVFRNVLGDRSKLFAELTLGTNPRFKAFYTVSNGFMPSFGAELETYTFSFGNYEDDVKKSQMDFSTFNFSAFLTRTQGNVLNWRMGLQYEYFRFKQDITTDSILQSMENFQSYANAFISMKGDTRDKPYFSATGFLFSAKVLYVVPLSNDWSSTLFSNSLIVYANYEQNIRVNDKLVIRPGLFAGGTLRDEYPPVQHLFGLGGLNDINYLENFVPFAGVHFVQRLGIYSGIVRMQVQYNVYKKIYFTLLADAGNVAQTTEELFDANKGLLGYGGTISYNSFIGPVELSLLGSNVNSGAMVFFNLGFSF